MPKKISVRNVAQIKSSSMVESTLKYSLSWAGNRKDFKAINVADVCADGITVNCN